MNQFFLIITLWLVFSSPVIAAIQTITNGQSLVISCQQALYAVDNKTDSLEADVQSNAFICFSYLSGIIGAARYTDLLAKLRYASATQGIDNAPEFKLYCIDWNIQYQKAARIVLSYARLHPDNLDKPAHELALHALQKRYPCH
jgi:hydrogenase maturation factor